jgi:hypothetical protein
MPIAVRLYNYTNIREGKRTKMANGKKVDNNERQIWLPLV